MLRRTPTCCVAPAAPQPAATVLPQKSSNVLLTAGGSAKLSDLGLARLIQSTFLSDLPLVGTFAW